MGLPIPTFAGPVLDDLGHFVESWQNWLIRIATTTISITGNFATTFVFTGPTNITIPTTGTLATTVTAVRSFALAVQPTLAAGDANSFWLVTDYAHLVYWDGAAWQWADGDRPGRFGDFDSDPGIGWGLCDGSTYTALVVGATLTTRNIVTPDLKGTPAYKKSAAAYTGTLKAASGTTGTGTTGTGTTGTANTGDTSVAHTHSPGAGVLGGTQPAVGAWDTSVVSTGMSANDPHHHSVPGLSVPGLSVPALGVGSLDMARLDVLPYVRR